MDSIIRKWLNTFDSKETKLSYKYDILKFQGWLSVNNITFNRITLKELKRLGPLQPIDGWFPQWSPSFGTLSTRDTLLLTLEDAWKRPNEQRSSKPTHKRNSSNIEVLETTTTIKTIKNKTKHTEIGRVVQENIPWTTTNTTFQRRDCLRRCDTFNWNYIFM